MEKAKRHPRWTIVATAAVMGIASLTLGSVQGAEAQVREVIKPVRIVQIYGRDTLEVGEMETYRVRVDAPYETAYRWRITGGDEIGGNPIVYQFDEPGRYELIATARNPKGSDTDTLMVVVLGERPPPTVLASNQEADPESSKAADSKSEKANAKSSTPAKPGAKSNAGKSEPEAVGLKTGTQGPFTWLIATYFQRTHAEALANAYRAVGYRAAVIIDSGGKGSTVFRVALGQFETEQKALEAKAEVKSHGVKNPLLHQMRGA